MNSVFKGFAFSQISTVITLIAFIVSLIITFLLRRISIKAKENRLLIDKAPADDRAGLIKQYLSREGYNLSAEGIGKERSFELIKSIERAKQRKFYFSLTIVFLLAVLSGFLVYESLKLEKKSDAESQVTKKSSDSIQNRNNINNTEQKADKIINNQIKGNNIIVNQ